MREFDIGIIETFLNSHDMDDQDWFLPDVPAKFDAWASGSAAARGAHDCAEATQRDIGSCIRSLAERATTTASDVLLARDVRDGFLAMILDGEPPEALDRLARQLPVALRVGTGSTIAVEPVEGGPRGVAALALLAAHRLAVSGDWPRLRLCKNERCHWAFFDRSKNGSRVWCNMGTCGARAKARAYRARQNEVLRLLPEKT